MTARLHVVGGGMAGLACAVEAVGLGWAVTVHEAAPRAGGRCRSYHDGRLGRVIDNGSHLMLAANTETRRLLATTGGWRHVREAEAAAFAFHDLGSGHGWTVRPNRGRLPWWIFSAGRRTPRTTAAAHLRDLWRLATAAPGDTVTGRLGGSALYGPLWHPVAEAVMNTAPAEASARTFWAVVRDSLARGEAACRPWLFPEGLGAALVEPTLAWLRTKGAEVRLSAPVKALALGPDGPQRLETRADPLPLGRDDRVVLALPAFALRRLLPDLPLAEPPTRAIVNAHFLLPRQVTLPPPGFVGLIGGHAHWVFARGDVLSVTVSDADALAEYDDDTVARLLWGDAARLPPLAALRNHPPPCRVVRERRATIAHTPAVERSRPGTTTPWRSVLLAGDWTATGYPCTVEGAVRSGVAAARKAGPPPHG